MDYYDSHRVSIKLIYFLLYYIVILSMSPPKKNIYIYTDSIMSHEVMFYILYYVIQSLLKKRYSVQDIIIAYTYIFLKKIHPANLQLSLSLPIVVP